MSAAAVRVGAWRVWLPEAGGAAEATRWIALVERAVAEGASLHRSKHAQTYRRSSPAGEVYVKVYRRYRRRTAAKDLLRASKARNVLRVSVRLAGAGFRVPRVLAAGEERVGPVVRRAWVVTRALEGVPIADCLAELAGRGCAGARRAKRALLAVLGREVARLHAVGVVAGDLVPANVWIVGEADGEHVALLDHDRTRAGRGAAPWWRARRNLVQLNRVLLPGVTATDRLRVYRAYAAGRAWAWPAARRRLRWVVAKTIARRRRIAEAPAGARRRPRERP